MSCRSSKYLLTAFLSFLILVLISVQDISACNGNDVILSTQDNLTDENGRYFARNADGNLLVPLSDAYITPDLARGIAEKFLIDNFSPSPLPLTFRKLEYVHRKLVYQFESRPLKNYNGKYHLGPVNFKVKNWSLTWTQ